MKRIVLLLVVACGDPVQSAQRDALGPEDPSVPRGELHRPGQPCFVCHDNFAAAGTIYQEDLVTPFEGATVTLTDAAGSQATATTNSAGNFIIRKSEWKPTFPIGSYTDGNGNAVFGVAVVGTDPNNSAQMITQIGRDLGCNACHGPARTASSPGPIYITTGATP
jgi:hypothetical protein